MSNAKIGILHPGEMGISVAASAKNAGNQVYWASAGRGTKSIERASKQGLLDAGSVAELCAQCSIILSICPPHAAEEIAAEVIATGFKGLYLDGNAISPQRALQIGERMAAAGIHFVDGGIIGGPAWKPQSTWLYLSGAKADEIAACFAAGPLETKVMGDTIGAASALKMAYAAYTKGSTALLAASIATADFWNVRDALAQQWDQERAGQAEQNFDRVRKVTAKAWRFVGEMEEIAATFRSAGVPGEFHDAAATVYQRMAEFKDAAATPNLDDVLQSLLDHERDK